MNNRIRAGENKEKWNTNPLKKENLSKGTGISKLAYGNLQWFGSKIR